MSNGNRAKAPKCAMPDCKEPRALRTKLCLYHIHKREWLSFHKLGEFDAYLKKEAGKQTGKGRFGKVVKE